MHISSDETGVWKLSSPLAARRSVVLVSYRLHNGVVQAWFLGSSSLTMQ